MRSARREHRQPATLFATRLFLGVARCFALAWLVPALLFNVDWTGHGSWQANTAAVFMILGSALFIEGALRLRHWVLSPICVFASLFLVYVNTKQATRVISFGREAATEAKAAEIAGGSHLASQRSHLLARREAQVQLAGEKAVGTLGAELAAVIASDARQWRISSQCEAPNGPITGAFCTRVAAARAKVEAAKARDRIDAELARLPAPTMLASSKVEAPVADAYVANVVALLKEAGFKPTARLVKAEEAMARALGFELLAALGPTCWLAFLNMLAAGGAYASAAAARMRKALPKPEKLKNGDGGDRVSALSDDADDLDRCIADVFEDAPGGAMRAKEIRPIVAAWFDARGKRLVESELWARLGQRFKRDPNNGRPRYLGLKARAKGPPKLAVVAGNEA